MRVVVAPDSFKGSLAAPAAAAALRAGWASRRPGDVVLEQAMADGGEGTLDVLGITISGARRVDVGPVTGPTGDPVPGWYLELPDGTAAVELAVSSGLPLAAGPAPLTATTRGLGEVIVAALDRKPRRLLIALGGSASTDGGAGALEALGMRLYDGAGSPVARGGVGLRDVTHVDAAALLPPPADGVLLLTDVVCPLLGPDGAAATFGPQKGATAGDVALLDAALARFAAVLGGDPGQPGAGAAGGTAFGLVAAWSATVEPGAAAVARLTGLDDAVRGADLVLTGEGCFDATSMQGKAVGEVLATAERHGADAWVVSGRSAPGVGRQETNVLTLVEVAGSTEAAMAAPDRWLATAAASLADRYGTKSSVTA